MPPAWATLLTAALNGIQINIGNFHFSFTFPTYIGAMLIAAVIRNFCDAKHIVMPSRALDLWGNVSLSIFLAIALMSVALWQLASVAVAMIAMLAAQTILMYFYARFVVYNIMGRDYEAAVMTAAFCGFGMGATPNAMANMQAVTKRYGPGSSGLLRSASGRLPVHRLLQRPDHHRLPEHPAHLRLSSESFPAKRKKPVPIGTGFFIFKRKSSIKSGRRFPAPGAWPPSSTWRPCSAPPR